MVDSPAVIVSLRTFRERWAERLAASKRVADLNHWFESVRVVVGENAWNALVPKDGEAPEAPPNEVSNEEPSLDAGLAPAGGATHNEATTSKSKKTRQSKLLWLNSVLSASDRGMKREELIELARAEPIASGYNGDDEAYAYWLASTAQRGRVRRRGAWYLSQELWERLAQDPTTLAQYRSVDLRSIIIEVIKEMGGGPARAGDIVERVRANPAVFGSITPTSNYPYVLLSRMTVEGAVRREGRDYFLPEKQSVSDESLRAPHPMLKLIGEGR